MIDNLYTGEESRQRLINGIVKSAEAVGATMGTRGTNAIIEALEHPGHLMTNDGATILESIHFADPLEEMGRKILLEAVSRANKQSGDGSSTTCVLTAAIIREGLKYIHETPAIEIKKSLEAHISIIEEAISEQKKEISVSEVGKVASISAEDEEIGALIQEIYEKIGREGIIHWDISKTTEDTYTIGNGITIEGAGFASPYMCDMDEKSGQFLNVIRWKNPRILITKQKLTSAADFEGLFATLNAKGTKEVVVFCDEFEPTIIAQLVQTRAVRGFKTMVVKMPVLWKDQWFEDVALATGATVIDPNAGMSLKDAKEDHLGTIGHIVVSKDDTFLDGIQDISAHVAKLKEGDDEAQLRASRLNTNTARLFIGAHSESALSYKRLKVEDAIAAAWQALNGGIVSGGGVALMNIGVSLSTDSVGGKILGRALAAPFKRIGDNAGYKWPQQNYVQRIFKEKPRLDLDKGMGIDTRTNELVNMIDAGITDPANITVNAVKSAISVAGTLLTAPTSVLLPREDTVSQRNYPIVR